MAGLENFGDKLRSNTFADRPEDRTKGGRPPSIKKEIREIFDSQDSIIWVNKQPEERIHEGKKQWGLQLTRKERLIEKLDCLIMKGKDSISLNALKFVFKLLSDDKESNAIKIENTQVNINETNIQYIVVTTSAEYPFE